MTTATLRVVDTPSIQPVPPRTFAPVAEDAVTRELIEVVRSVARSSVTVLLTGESGVGKEVFARMLHDLSPRARGPFVAVNCAAIPADLLESTLFGWVKGAFTGAQRSEAGTFEAAQGGTLLLDEISELPLALQAKLLRVLQERKVERVGGHDTIALDIRIVATSNRNLAAAVRQGAFREDLYYRLNVFPLEVPPLRARLQDVLPLARYFVSRAAASAGTQPASIEPDAEAVLLAHPWPGNVRELENVINRALILSNGGTIEARHVRLDAVRVCAPADALAPSAFVDMATLERNHILGTLAAVGGSRKRTVEILRISERTLRYKLAEYRRDGWMPTPGRGGKAAAPSSAESTNGASA